jgi:NAD(P)-dependent dehydrogenase (short-subunit alcohol dehydrogenase family)
MAGGTAARSILITGAPRALSLALAERLAGLPQASVITGGVADDRDRNELAGITDLVHMDAVVDEPRFSAASGAAVVKTNIVAAISLLKALPALKRMYYVCGAGAEDDAGVPRTLCGLTQVAVENFFRLHARRTGMSLLVHRLAGANDAEFTATDVDAVAKALSR